MSCPSLVYFDAGIGVQDFGGLPTVLTQTGPQGLFSFYYHYAALPAVEMERRTTRRVSGGQGWP